MSELLTLLIYYLVGYSYTQLTLIRVTESLKYVEIV